MDDRSKVSLSIIFLGSALLLPFLGLAGGWSWFDLRLGSIMALITFAFFLLLGAIFLLTIREPTTWMAAAPFCAGVIYTLSFDPIPGGFDDALVMGVMSALTFVLWRRRKPNLSWWAVLPLLGVAVYEIIGGFIPGPFDEILVAALGAGISLAIGGHTRGEAGDGTPSAPGINKEGVITIDGPGQRAAGLDEKMGDPGVIDDG